MILSFSRDSFEGAIKAGTKIHTIRRDEHNRWKPGMTIKFWMGSPMNVKNNPYQFGKGVVDRVARIDIFPKRDIVIILFSGEIFEKITSRDELNRLAVNDGFKDWEDMKTWFTEDFSGKLIIWKEFEEIN